MYKRQYLVNGVEDPGAALENARRQSLAVANDLVRAYGMLDVKLNKSLIDNIMILGLRHAVEPLDPEMVKAELGEPDSWANYLQK